ncbi:MAG: deoxyguanosinetriphosphate triphosphohydrolase, partial [Thermodesulfovibrionales bacterium]
ERVYENPTIINEFNKAKKILKELYFYYIEHIDIITEKNPFPISLSTDDKYTIASDFVSGMTDRFALSCYERLFIPNQWF